MKPEKEVLWIVNLLKGGFIKKMFGGSISGCKSDFERVAMASENNAIFRNWMNKLIEEGDIEFHDRRKIVGKYVDTYVINKSKLIKRFKNTDFYDSLTRIMVILDFK